MDHLDETDQHGRAQTDDRKQNDLVGPIRHQVGVLVLNFLNFGWGHVNCLYSVAAAGEIWSERFRGGGCGPGCIAFPFLLLHLGK